MVVCHIQNETDRRPVWLACAPPWEEHSQWRDGHGRQTGQHPQLFGAVLCHREASKWGSNCRGSSARGRDLWWWSFGSFDFTEASWAWMGMISEGSPVSAHPYQIRSASVEGSCNQQRASGYSLLLLIWPLPGPSLQRGAVKYFLWTSAHLLPLPVLFSSVEDGQGGPGSEGWPQPAQRRHHCSMHSKPFSTHGGHGFTTRRAYPAEGTSAELFLTWAPKWLNKRKSIQNLWECLKKQSCINYYMQTRL